MVHEVMPLQETFYIHKDLALCEIILELFQGSEILWNPRWGVSDSCLKACRSSDCATGALDFRPWIGTASPTWEQHG